MEHRKQERIPLLTPLIVIDREDNRSIGYAADISREGVLLILQESVETGRVMDIRIHLPQGAEFAHCDVRIEARWHGKNINPSLECIGCLFLEVKPDELEEMLKVANALRPHSAIKLNWVSSMKNASPN